MLFLLPQKMSHFLRKYFVPWILLISIFKYILIFSIIIWFLSPWQHWFQCSCCVSCVLANSLPVICLVCYTVINSTRAIFFSLSHALEIRKFFWVNKVLFFSVSHQHLYFSSEYLLPHRRKQQQFLYLLSKICKVKSWDGRQTAEQ